MSTCMIREGSESGRSLEGEERFLAQEAGLGECLFSSQHTQKIGTETYRVPVVLSYVTITYRCSQTKPSQAKPSQI